MNSRVKRQVRDLIESKRLPSPSVARELRKDSGLTMSEMASLTGVSRQSVWAWESGAFGPSGLNRERYSEVLTELKRLLQV